MTINSDLKERIDNHEERIRYLEIDSARNQETLSHLIKNQEELKHGIQKLENTTINNNNAILNTLNQLVITKDNNNTQKSISKYTNITLILKQLLITGGAVIIGIWGSSKLIQ